MLHPALERVRRLTPVDVGVHAAARRQDGSLAASKRQSG